MITYLNEKSLGEYCKLFWPNDNLMFNKGFKFNTKIRPDIANYTRNIVVEFDGYRHYNDALTILKDEIKDKIYLEYNFKVIRIPYFVQLSKDVVEKEFSIILEKDLYNYPHGFIDDNALLPANMNMLGNLKYQKDLVKFYYIVDDILKSIDDKIIKFGDRRYVI